MEMEPFVFRHGGAVVGVRSLADDDGTAAEVNRFTLRPLGKDEYAVFALDLCHNQKFAENARGGVRRLVPVCRGIATLADLRKVC